MTDIDVIVPVGGRTDDLTALHRRRSEALHAAGYRPSFTYVLDGDLHEATRSAGGARPISRTMSV